MNWGKGVTIAFVLFVGFIMFMVVGAFRQNFDLVADDYYKHRAGSFIFSI